MFKNLRTHWYIACRWPYFDPNVHDWPGSPTWDDPQQKQEKKAKRKR